MTELLQWAAFFGFVGLLTAIGTAIWANGTERPRALQTCGAVIGLILGCVTLGFAIGVALTAEDVRGDLLPLPFRLAIAIVICLVGGVISLLAYGGPAAAAEDMAKAAEASKPVVPYPPDDEEGMAEWAEEYSETVASGHYRWETT